MEAPESKKGEKKMNKEKLSQALELVNSAMDLLVAEFNAMEKDQHSSDEGIILTDVIGSVADAQGQLKDLTR